MHRPPAAELFPLPSSALLISLLLFLAPAVQLVWRGGTGYCFFILFLMAVAGLATGRVRGGREALRDHPWFWAGMLAFSLAIPLQWAVMGFVDARRLDALSRFTLVLPIYLMLRRLPSRRLAVVGWGCAAGAIAVGVRALGFHTAGVGPYMTRLNNVYTNAIPFGDMALLLAVLALSTLGGGGPEGGAGRALRLLALAGGAYASYLSGTRGGWIAIPALALLLAVRFRGGLRRRGMLLAAMVGIACVAALAMTPVVRNRVAAADRNIAVIRAGGHEEATSIGARLDLWRGSVQLFERHPLYGVGKGRLAQGLTGLAREGAIPAHVVNERAHSDFFSAIAELGSVGAICLALLYAGLAQPFWRDLRASDPVLRSAASSGMVVALATVVFGLTIDDLAPVMVDALTALLAATFLAMVDARRRELGAAASPATDRLIRH